MRWIVFSISTTFFLFFHGALCSPSSWPFSTLTSEFRMHIACDWIRLSFRSGGTIHRKLGQTKSMINYVLFNFSQVSGSWTRASLFLFFIWFYFLLFLRCPQKITWFGSLKPIIDARWSNSIMNYFCRNRLHSISPWNRCAIRCLF